MCIRDSWESEWENADPTNKTAGNGVPIPAKPQPSDNGVSMPAGHPSVPTDGSAALCPYLLRGAGGESDAPLSNGGRVPRGIYLVTLLDMLGVGLVIPIIPAYAKSLGATPSAIGLMGTMYGLAQLIGASVLGDLSDTRGRRHVLQMSMLGAGCGYSLLALSVGSYKSLGLLMLSRIPVGLAKQTMTMSRAVVTDCTTTADRTPALSTLAITIGVGFIFGPAVGGILSSKNMVAPPALSVLLFMVAFAIVRSMPETAPYADQIDAPVQKRSSTWEQTRGFKLDKYPQLVVFLGCKAVITLAYLLLEFSFALYTSQRFGLEPKANGFVLAYAGIVAVVSQMGVVTWLTRRFSGDRLVVGGAAVLAVSLVGIALASNLYVFLGAIAILSLGRAIFRTVCDTIITQAAASEDVGVVSGIADGCDSGCRVVSPLLGGILIEWYGVAAPPAAGAVMIAVAIVLMQIKVKWKGDKVA
eukprot:TRINITY_DN27271_c0_g1_i2.p1 TRINITY_DN27271_c0_g1~~TRINITY_DN27271_c0_g1_i2.p1  ORF type:complete len:471 (-),score=84.38 TRINITY_DN27271_c0_g1_i2:150-1562(-)